MSATAQVTPRGGYFAKDCVRKVWNDLDPTIPDELKDSLSEAVRHRMEEGNVFEDHVETLLKQSIVGSKTCSRKAAEFAPLVSHEAVGELRWNGSGQVVAAFLIGDRTTESKQAREEATMLAVSLGVPMIWNPRVPAVMADNRVGEPDFMCRFGEQVKADGNWAYVPGDVKHHRALDGTAKPKLYPVAALDTLRAEATVPTELGRGSPRKEDAYQLAHYTEMFDAHGIGLPAGHRKLGLLIGKEEVALLHDLDAPAFLKDVGEGRGRVSAMEAYNFDWDARMAIAEAAVTNTAEHPVLPLVKPTKRTECGDCVWASYCDTLRKTTNDVSRVIGVTVEQAELHAERGTDTVSDLARLDVPTAMVVDAGLDAVHMIAEARAADPRTSAATLLGVTPDAEGATKTKTDRQAGLIARLAEVNVSTAADLAALCEVTASYTGSKAQRLVDQIDRARVLTIGKTHRARGAEFVDITRSSIELHVDIEDNGGFVYLIGVKAFGKAKSGKDAERRRSEYHAFHTWETTPEAEAKVLADWWDYVEGMQAYAKINRWGVRGFCYTHHERSTLIKKAAEHAGFEGVPTPEELTAFFDSDAWVDLHEAVKSDVLFPAEDIKLKTVATKVCGFVWRDEDPSGGNSMAWYATAVDPTVDEAEREAARQRLLDYNDDDCHATYAIAEWFSANGQARRPGAAIPSVESLDRLFGQLRRPGPTPAPVAQAEAA